MIKQSFERRLLIIADGGGSGSPTSWLTKYVSSSLGSVFWQDMLDTIWSIITHRCSWLAIASATDVSFFLASLDGQPCIGQIRYCIFLDLLQHRIGASNWCKSQQLIRIMIRMARLLQRCKSFLERQLNLPNPAYISINQFCTFETILQYVWYTVCVL